MKHYLDQIVPVTLAIVLHVTLLGLMVYGFEFSRPAQPLVRLAVKATLVTEEAPKPKPEPVQQPEPEPEPVIEPEPVPVEEEPQEDIAAAEEAKRQEDLKVEQQRIAAETKRKEQEKKAADEKRAEQEKVAADKKRVEQEKIARKKREQEAERKRQEDVARQRAENERKRREAEEAERKAQSMRELEDEESLQEVLNSDLLTQYSSAIMQKIEQKWIRPTSAQPGMECTVNVRQGPSGEVFNVTIDSCNGDDAVRRSIEAAVYKASPLPVAPDPRLFERNLRIVFKPEQ